MIKSCLVLFILLLFSINTAFSQNQGISANGELALRAFQKCFPDKVSDIIYDDNDWAIIAGGETFYWAGGRLLPKVEKDKADNYGPHMFYLVPEKPSPPDTFSPQYIETLRSRGAGEARLERKDTHRGFQEIIYGAKSQKEIEGQIKSIEFLGFKVSVHKDIAEPLNRIDAAIRKLDGGKEFISSLSSIGGYSWREIKGTQRMSYHSWGLAIDIQPKALGGKAIYWLWERGRNKDWMLVPLDKRWNPPIRIIQLFEQEGFIWGGKWPLYDNMHFEYRPELHEFTRLLAVQPVSNIENNYSNNDLHHIYPDQLGVSQQ